MANNPNNIRLSACRVRFGGRDLGFTAGGVDVAIKTDSKSIEVDQYGMTPVNEIIMGRTLTVKCPFSETDLDTYYALMGPTGAILKDDGTVATGSFTLASQPAAGTTLTLNGYVFTFVSVATGVTGQILLGSSVAGTVANALRAIQSAAGPGVDAATYAIGSNNMIVITMIKSGVAGNAYSLATTAGAAITLSGTSLVNGADGARNVTIGAGVGVSLFANAQALVLHPVSRGDQDYAEDFTVPLASQPGSIDFSYKYDNVRIFTVTFTGYLNTATNVLAIYGDTAA